MHIHIECFDAFHHSRLSPYLFYMVTSSVTQLLQGKPFTVGQIAGGKARWLLRRCIQRHLKWKGVGTIILGHVCWKSGYKRLNESINSLVLLSSRQCE